MSVKDLISAAFNKDATSFESTLHAIMQDKMGAAIQARFSPAVYEEEVDLDEAKDDSEDDESTEEDDDEEEEDMKEEVDQIDEISASTLGSYVRKGTKDIEKSYDEREKARDVDDSKTARAMGLRARKREKGVSNAISKLTGHYTTKVPASDK